MTLKKDAQRVLKLMGEKVIATDYEIKEKFKEGWYYEYLLELLHQNPTEKNKKMIAKIQSFKTFDDLCDFFVYLKMKSLINAF